MRCPIRTSLWGYCLFSSSRSCQPTELLPGRKPQKLNLDSTEFAVVRVQIENILKSVKNCYSEASTVQKASANTRDSLQQVFTTLKVVLGDFEWGSTLEHARARRYTIPNKHEVVLSQQPVRSKANKLHNVFLFTARQFNHSAEEMEILLNDLNASAVRKAYKSKSIALHWVDTSSSPQAASEACDAVYRFLRYTGGATCHIGQLLQSSNVLPFELIFESICDEKIQESCLETSTTMTYSGHGDDLQKIVDVGIEVDVKDGLRAAISNDSKMSCQDVSTLSIQALKRILECSTGCSLVIEKAVDKLKLPYGILNNGMCIVRERIPAVGPPGSDSESCKMKSKFMQIIPSAIQQLVKISLTETEAKKQILKHVCSKWIVKPKGWLTLKIPNNPEAEKRNFEMQALLRLEIPLLQSDLTDSNVDPIPESQLDNVKALLSKIFVHMNDESRRGYCREVLYNLFGNMLPQTLQKIFNSFDIDIAKPPVAEGIPEVVPEAASLNDSESLIVGGDVVEIDCSKAVRSLTSRVSVSSSDPRKQQLSVRLGSKQFKAKTMKRSKSTVVETTNVRESKLTRRSKSVSTVSPQALASSAVEQPRRVSVSLLDRYAKQEEGCSSELVASISGKDDKDKENCRSPIAPVASRVFVPETPCRKEAYSSPQAVRTAHNGAAEATPKRDQVNDMPHVRVLVPETPVTKQCHQRKTLSSGKKPISIARLVSAYKSTCEASDSLQMQMEESAAEPNDRSPCASRPPEEPATAVQLRDQLNPRVIDFADTHVEGVDDKESLEDLSKISKRRCKKDGGRERKRSKRCTAPTSDDIHAFKVDDFVLVASEKVSFKPTSKGAQAVSYSKISLAKWLGPFRVLALSPAKQQVNLEFPPQLSLDSNWAPMSAVVKFDGGVSLRRRPQEGSVRQVVDKKRLKPRAAVSYLVMHGDETTTGYRWMSKMELEGAAPKLLLMFEKRQTL
eukprot:763159-Hanusia_phi.AAC.9